MSVPAVRHADLDVIEQYSAAWAAATCASISHPG